MNLVVQADLAVGPVFVTGKLDAVHAEVGMPPSRPGHVLGIDERQRHERATVAGPAHQLRELTNRRLAIEDGAMVNALGQGVPRGAQHAAISPRMAEYRGWVGL